MTKAEMGTSIENALKVEGARVTLPVLVKDNTNMKGDSK